MKKHAAEALVVTCIDFRIQEYINNWISENFQPKTFDRVAIAGGVKNLDFILGQVNVAVRLHHINEVVLISHEDCGAYGTESTHEKHSKDLRNTVLKVKEMVPNLEVECYYLHLNGTFEKIN